MAWPETHFLKTTRIDTTKTGVYLSILSHHNAIPHLIEVIAFGVRDPIYSGAHLKPWAWDLV